MSFGDGAADAALRTAWDDFCDKLRAAGNLVFKDYNPGEPLLRADAFRFLTQNLGQAFDLALETKDPAFPQIHPFCTPTRKLGADCADFTYRQAWIDGEHRYRITGKRGTARFFNVTVQGPRPAPREGVPRALHEPFGDTPQANIVGHQLNCAPDGSFELFIGGEQAGPNWLPTTPGTRKLFIREGFDAWDETPTPLSIERLGMEGPRPLPTPERMVEAMEWAGNFLTGMMTDWPDHPYEFGGALCDRFNFNKFPPGVAANTADDAKRGRMAAHMCWELAPDEALIVAFNAHSGFWMMTMNAIFMDSYDFLYRPVSYTPARTKVDADGKVRLVLAHDDPGVANWLDTQSFSKGNLAYRNMLSQEVAEFESQTVKRADLLAALPPGTAMVTPAERLAEMHRRYRGIKQRYGI